jgi:hypothetical protein
VPARGGGALPSSGSLLEISGEAELSNVRRRDGALEARVWNRRGERDADTTIASRPLTLGPARIETIRL